MVGGCTALAGIHVRNTEMPQVIFKKGDTAVNCRDTYLLLREMDGHDHTKEWNANQGLPNFSGGTHMEVYP